VALPPIPDNYEAYLDVLRGIDDWYRGQAGSKSGPLEFLPQEITRPVLDGACPYCPNVRLDQVDNDDPTWAAIHGGITCYDRCPCCGHEFTLYPLDPDGLPSRTGRGLIEHRGHDRCGHVRAFLLPRGLALTGGYVSPPRSAWEHLRRGKQPPPGLRA
jgi:hypothetical protein